MGGRGRQLCHSELKANGAHSDPSKSFAENTNFASGLCRRFFAHPMTSSKSSGGRRIKNQVPHTRPEINHTTTTTAVQQQQRIFWYCHNILRRKSDGSSNNASDSLIFVLHQFEAIAKAFNCSRLGGKA